ncbi:MAG: sn-glycerol-3-phosphate ABC transporter ATP-binding protein UgpC [Thiofilum sp.]|uniref:ABC transporter ATP-binding protein n=1 Tax=Thiofilum sp. TaxID=2212733 RepID=UPI0025F54BCF|nr:sn-glycerol-3-phosphate ABC transporter ATP-binding protein UgpC [Thiofilum sp.]MBK8454790.1 sn-glycerol-3-phosphate ABC transporter ATP-binding protein UgpC [Thiofilum sp.]
MAALSLQQVVKRFEKLQVLHGINLDIQDGEFVVFVGPSGCGKSTLLRLIAGLESIDEGELYIGGEPVKHLSPRERGIAMVFQSYALYPHMSVYKNMAFGLKTDGQTNEFIDKKIRDAAAKLHLDHLLDRKPGQLSGGQRQRVAIGRAIVRDPRVFLFDEPLSNLDAALRVKMRIEIARLQKMLNTTTIYVTHDQVEAMTLADKIVVLNGGRIEQVGAPMELYHKPANTFVAGFIGSPAMNLIPCQIQTVSDQTVNVAIGKNSYSHLPFKATTTGSATLGIRPEHLSLEPNDLRFDGKVESIERMGDITYLYLSSEGTEFLTVAQQGDWAIPIGDTISVYCHRNQVHLFDHNNQALERLNNKK